MCTLYQSFQEGTGPSTGGLMDRTKDAAGRQAGAAAGDASLLRPCHKHMSATERLRKVIQELVDTEKSYVKVGPPSVPYFLSPRHPRAVEFDLFPPRGFADVLGDARQFFGPTVPYLRPDLGCMGREREAHKSV